jgi:hypothetical protein
VALLILMAPVMTTKSQTSAAGKSVAEGDGCSGAPPEARLPRAECTRNAELTLSPLSITLRASKDSDKPFYAPKSMWTVA